MASDTRYDYVAIDPSGRRSRGAVLAFDDAAAFEQLRRSGLSPISLKPKSTPKTEARVRALNDRDGVEFLSSLAELLKAGADIRTALNILSTRFEKDAVTTVCDRLATDIGGGEALDVAFARNFQKKQAMVAPMVAAGEQAGDLAGGLQRASEVLLSRIRLRDQIVSVMAYPTFVFISAVGALLVILLFIVPAIAPLATEMGSTPTPALRAMIFASDFLRANALLFPLAFVAVLAGALAAYKIGLLRGFLAGIFLDGPARRTVGGLIFGSFAISLGTMLTAGAPIGEALRLAIRSISSATARQRLEAVNIAVRQGETLSNALANVRGFPSSIIRLAAVGEASNAVGQLLLRSGRMEEERALKRIETVGKIAGPALIILLGALLGVLMGGLLSSVSTMGQSVLGN